MLAQKLAAALHQMPFLSTRKGNPNCHNFSWMVEAFRKRLSEHPERGEGHASISWGRVGVLITPWLRTAVPFYSLEVGMALADAGADVTLLWDASNAMENASKVSEVKAISSLFPYLPHSIKLANLTVEVFADHVDVEDLQWSKTILKENAIARLRKEKGAEQYALDREDQARQMASHLDHVRKSLKKTCCDWIFVPGGIYALSAIYVEAARQVGVAFTTYDSGYAMIVIHDGVATHQSDISLAAKLLRRDADFSQEVEDRIVEIARKEIDARMGGRGNSQQIVASGQQSLPPCDVLVPLNLRWDSAALCRLKLFSSFSEWMIQTANWARERNAKVCFRQHPCERDPDARGYDDIAGLLESLDPEGEFLHFARAEDPVSTYDLILAAKAVLPFTSTVGIEAAMLGKPVILSAHCYYESFSFARPAGDVAEYFALLDRAVKGELNPGESAVREAAVAYYLAQICLYLYTPFLIANADYAKWVEMPPGVLWSQPENQDLLEALLTRVPVSIVRHRRLIARRG